MVLKIEELKNSHSDLEKDYYKVLQFLSCFKYGIHIEELKKIIKNFGYFKYITKISILESLKKENSYYTIVKDIVSLEPFFLDYFTK